MSEHEHPQANKAQRTDAHHRQLDGRRVSRGYLPRRIARRTAISAIAALAMLITPAARRLGGGTRWDTARDNASVAGSTWVRLWRLQSGHVEDWQASVGAYDVTSTVAGGEGAGVVLDDPQEASGTTYRTVSMT